ncbi:hypothetical protein [Mycolicibacterium sp. CBMA 226]|uniref:hypothetical protein n=1 Tax=Mycolicibacterium sp. CBMA 226 TaxID=2606611 RepID=UPI00130C2855|nr:hypothetical protein [Mycolicibacterium sp. CBMA 226]MUL78249.1 hypothetical protein [Mycolicibacterium sp. CBMA 226]
MGITDAVAVLPATVPRGGGYGGFGRDVSGGTATCPLCPAQAGPNPAPTGGRQVPPARAPQPLRLPEFVEQPDAASNPEPDPVDERVCDPADKTSACRGIVSVCLVKPDNTASPEIEAERQLYIDRGNILINRNTAVVGQDYLVRRSTKGMGARRANDIKNAEVPIPSGKAGGHMPDLVWGGAVDDRPVLPMDPSLNSSIGGQANAYRIGYQATKFVAGIWVQTGSGQFMCQAAGG